MSRYRLTAIGGSSTQGAVGRRPSAFDIFSDEEPPRRGPEAVATSAAWKTRLSSGLPPDERLRSAANRSHGGANRSPSHTSTEEDVDRGLPLELRITAREVAAKVKDMVNRVMLTTSQSSSGGAFDSSANATKEPQHTRRAVPRVSLDGPRSTHKLPVPGTKGRRRMARPPLARADDISDITDPEEDGRGAAAASPRYSARLVTLEPISPPPQPLVRGRGPSSFTAEDVEKKLSRALADERRGRGSVPLAATAVPSTNNDARTMPPKTDERTNELPPHGGSHRDRETIIERPAASSRVVAETAATLDRLRSTITDREAEIAELRKELALEKQASFTARHDLEVTKSAHAEQMAELRLDNSKDKQRLMDELLAAQRKASDATAHLREALAEADTAAKLRGDLERVQLQLEKEQLTLRETRRELDAALDDVRRRDAEVEVCRSDLAVTKDQLRSLEYEINDVRTKSAEDREQRDITIRRLENDLERARSSAAQFVDGAEKHIESLTRKLRDRKAELHKTQQDLQESIRRAELDREAYRAEIAGLNASLQQQRDACEAEAERCIEAEERCGALERAARELEARAGSAHMATISEYEAKLKAARAEVANLSHAKLDLEAELKEAKSRVAMLSQELEQRARAYEQLTKDRDRLGDVCASLRNDIDRLHNEQRQRESVVVRESESVESMLRRQLEASRAQSAHLTVEVERLRSTLNDLRGANRSMDQEIHAARVAFVNSSRTSNTSLANVVQPVRAASAGAAPRQFPSATKQPSTPSSMQSHMPTAGKLAVGEADVSFGSIRSRAGAGGRESVNSSARTPLRSASPSTLGVLIHRTPQEKPAADRQQPSAARGTPASQKDSRGTPAAQRRSRLSPASTSSGVSRHRSIDAAGRDAVNKILAGIVPAVRGMRPSQAAEEAKESPQLAEQAAGATRSSSREDSLTSSNDSAAFDYVRREWRKTFGEERGTV